MSAVTQNEYTQNDNTTVLRQFTFPYLKTSDIKVSLDGVATTAFTLPNATTIQLNSVPPNGTKIRIFRETGIDDLTATFYAGSAIKSEDLNDNFTQNFSRIFFCVFGFSNHITIFSDGCLGSSNDEGRRKMR